MKNTFAASLLCWIIAVLVSSCATNQPSSGAYYMRFAGTSATDITGKRYSSTDFGNASPPWLNDVVRGIAPTYPYEERAAHHQGRGFFQVILDLETGKVVTVKVAHSTGFKMLDESVIDALRQWQWQPKKWKKIDIPVNFKLDKNRGLPSGAVRLPTT